MSLATNTPLPTILLAVLAILALGGCAIRFDVDGDTTRQIERETLPVSDLAAIDISTENGAVAVRTGSNDEIEIEVRLEESQSGDADYSVTTEGDRLVLVGECDARWWRHCKVGFHAVVPDWFDVRVGTGSGAITIDGVSGELEVATANGAIDAEGLRAETVRADTDNGRVELAFDAPPEWVGLESGNGALAVRLPPGDSYDVDAASDNGAIDVDVRTAPGADRQVVARSGNGAIDVGYGSDGG